MHGVELEVGLGVKQKWGEVNLTTGALQTSLVVFLGVRGGIGANQEKKV